eukprot:GEMP01032576.1.p1 GENE.GEMP01032576.1~~GEMP01032576.1.p1  ORF type:complete len:514 (+),score=99.69 GEMP01032576.1:27-1568(+)
MGRGSSKLAGSKTSLPVVPSSFKRRHLRKNTTFIRRLKDADKDNDAHLKDYIGHVDPRLLDSTKKGSCVADICGITQAVSRTIFLRSLQWTHSTSPDFQHAKTDSTTTSAVAADDSTPKRVAVRDRSSGSCDDDGHKPAKDRYRQCGARFQARLRSLLQRGREGGVRSRVARRLSLCGDDPSQQWRERSDVGRMNASGGRKAGTRSSRWRVCVRRQHVQGISVNGIFAFTNKLVNRLYISKEILVLALIYLDRLLDAPKAPVIMDDTWRTLWSVSIIVASKVWEDVHPWNVDWVMVLRELRVPIFPPDLYALEMSFLKAIDYRVHVPAELYANYFFSLKDHEQASEPASNSLLDRTDMEKCRPSVASCDGVIRCNSSDSVSNVSTSFTLSPSLTSSPSQSFFDGLPMSRSQPRLLKRFHRLDQRNPIIGYFQHSIPQKTDIFPDREFSSDRTCYCNNRGMCAMCNESDQVTYSINSYSSNRTSQEGERRPESVSAGVRSSRRAKTIAGGEYRR